MDQEPQYLLRQICVLQREGLNRSVLECPLSDKRLYNRSYEIAKLYLVIPPVKDVFCCGDSGKCSKKHKFCKQSLISFKY